jgi:hypothetical protein
MTMFQMRPPAIVIVEGVHDIEFLKRIAETLRRDDSTLPDLRASEQAGLLLFIPIGGGEIAAWDRRLRRLSDRRFQLYDRETGAEASRRLTAVAGNPEIRLTSKRSLENYLHPNAIHAAGGPMVAVDDNCDVAAAIAKAWLPMTRPGLSWEMLTPRARRRLAYRAKRWLNTTAADAMTVYMLRERDPAGEVRSWLLSIAALAAR